MLQPIDLRSDTVTRPSPAMREAIARADVGDAVLGDDPTALELEALAARMLGKERALFFPSGIMANQTAVMLLAPAGTEALIDGAGHILNYEEGAAATWAGVQMRTVEAEGGFPEPEALERVVAGRSPYLPVASLLCLENTHNSAGGRVLPVARMAALRDVAQRHGLAVHLDGARLANASVATGRPMTDWTSLADTVMLTLSKGLGAPIGSMLAGTDEAMQRAWRIRRRLGGGMRQVGILAAAGLFALRENIDRLTDDHRRARRLAAHARALPRLRVPEPETNIVILELEPPLRVERVIEALDARGVRMVGFGPGRIRAVLHLDVTDAQVEVAGEALRAAVDAAAEA